MIYYVTLDKKIHLSKVLSLFEGFNSLWEVSKNVVFFFLLFAGIFFYKNIYLLKKYEPTHIIVLCKWWQIQYLLNILYINDAWITYSNGLNMTVGVFFLWLPKTFNKKKKFLVVKKIVFFYLFFRHLKIFIFCQYLGPPTPTLNKNIGIYITIGRLIILP